MISVLKHLSRRVQVIGKMEYRSRQGVLEFNRERDESLGIVVDCCNREMNRIGMRERMARDMRFMRGGLL